jgi:hypothetical protein
VLETTVAEMICKLIGQPPDALATFFGRSNCILRERDDPLASRGPHSKWLEMDMR